MLCEACSTIVACCNHVQACTCVLCGVRLHCGYILHCLVLHAHAQSQALHCLQLEKPQYDRNGDAGLRNMSYTTYTNM